MLIITQRNHNVSPARHAILDIGGSWSHFLFFLSGDKPRGDTISMSRSLKAVIKSVMGVFFLLMTLWNCVVCTEHKWIMEVLHKRLSISMERRGSQRKLRSSFVHQNVIELQRLFEPSSASSDRGNVKFWKGVYKFLPCAPLFFHLVLNVQEKNSLPHHRLLTTCFPCAT